MKTNYIGSIKYFLLFLIFGIAAALFIVYIKKPELLRNLMEPVQIVSSVAKEPKILKKTDGRINVLLLGVDSRSGGSAAGTYLTDTIMVVSVDEKGENPVLISIPRDLWVENNATKSKINAFYAINKNSLKSQKDPDYEEKSIQEFKKVVESVVGIPIHYYVIVGFDAFNESIDSVGGITVDVENTFDDYEYPIEGKENAFPESERYMHVHFDKGKQEMDGKKALIYARSRHSTNPVESGDFARSRRQQKVLEALKDKILSKDVLLNLDSLKGLYQSYKDNVQTDVSLTETILFVQSIGNKELNVGNIEKIVFSNEVFDESRPGSGLLIVPSEEDRVNKYNNQYVLVPEKGSFDSFHALIRKTIFSN
jgi:polyisoprenyl-teichoic acid--peptidoglycan teichoic acid transferase